MERKLAKRRKTTRIYYGTGPVPLYWTVPVSDAKFNITVKGTLMDALTGTPGQTIGCHLSNCVMRNKTEIPFEVHFAAFTKRAAYLVTRISKGGPTKAVRFQHDYAKFVELNDTDLDKAYIKTFPKLAEKKFTLRKPTKKRFHVPGSTPKGKSGGEHRAVVPAGALARAKKTGLITAQLEHAINNVAKVMR